MNDIPVTIVTADEAERADAIGGSVPVAAVPLRWLGPQHDDADVPG